jgi:hypothetical protein
MPVGYKVRLGNAEPIIVPDYRFAGDQSVKVKGMANTTIHMIHVVGNEFTESSGQVRGISPLGVSLPWIKALKGFMEDRATLTMALAMFAFRQKIRGNRQAVARARAQWEGYDQQRRYPGADGRERRQGANTVIENEAAKLEQLKTDSGAYNAYQDMRMFRQQVGIGQGLFEHYMGDTGDANLATATAMELPMLKMYEAAQQFWAESVFEELGNFAILQGIRRGTLRAGAVRIDTTSGYWMWDVEPAQDRDLSVIVTFPPIVQRDLSSYTTAIATIKQAEAVSGRQILPPKETAESVLAALGYGTLASTILAEMEDQEFVMPTVNDPTPPPEEPTEESVTEADIGKPLPDKEARKVPPIRKSEIDKAFDDWAALPSLEEMAKQLGFDSVDDLDDA